MGDRTWAVCVIPKPYYEVLKDLINQDPVDPENEFCYISKDHIPENCVAIQEDESNYGSMAWLTTNLLIEYRIPYDLYYGPGSTFSQGAEYYRPGDERYSGKSGTDTFTVDEESLTIPVFKLVRVVHNYEKLRRVVTDAYESQLFHGKPINTLIPDQEELDRVKVAVVEHQMKKSYRRIVNG